MTSVTAIESRLRAKWSELLGAEPELVSSDTNFFSLGGNSLLILSLHAFLAHEFNISLTLPELFENADFASMVHLVSRTVPRL